MAICCCAPLSLSAQSLTVTGRVVHRRDTDRPLARQWVVLQVAAQDTAGSVDSIRTDGAGRYRMTFGAGDTSSLYVVSTTYQGVEYFTEVLRAGGRSRVDAARLVVYDTTSEGPPMRLERRLLVLARAGPRGGFSVQEVIEVSNPHARTRIAADSARPVWSLTLPSGVTAWAPREGNVAPEAVSVAGDRLSVFAPIWPGWPLRTSYEYALPGREARVPVGQWTGELNLLVEDTTAELSGVPLDALGVHDVEGGRFAAYRGDSLEAGGEVRVTLSRGPMRAEDLLPYLVAAVAVALGWGLWVALKRQPRG